MKKLQYFSGGRWLDSKTEKYMDVYNPSTGEVIAQAPCCTKDEVEAAIEAAAAAFPDIAESEAITGIIVIIYTRISSRKFLAT